MSMRENNRINFFFVLAFLLFLILSAYNGFTHGRFDFVWGMRDHLSDVNTLISAENFKKYGFIKLFFRVYHQPIPEDTISNIPFPSYKGYPPLSDWVNGILMKIGFDRVRDIRFFYLAISVIGLISIFIFTSKLFGKYYGLFSVFFIGLSDGFALFSSSIYAHPFTFLFPYLVMLFSLIYAERREKKYAFLVFLFSFLNTLSSYDFVPYPFVFSLLYTLFILKDRKLAFKISFFILLGSSTAFILWFFINSTERGIIFALDDLLMRFRMRTGGFGEGEKIDPPLFLLGKMILFFEDFFGWGTSAIILWFLVCYFLMKLSVSGFGSRIFSKLSKEGSQRNDEVLLYDKTFILFLSSISWTIFMPQHFLIHLYFIIPRNFGLFVSIVLMHFVRWALKLPRGISLVFVSLFVFSQIDKVVDALTMKREKFFTGEAVSIFSSLRSYDKIYINFSPYPYIVLRYYVRQLLNSNEIKYIYSFDEVQELLNSGKESCTYVFVQKYYPRFFLENYGNTAPISSFIREIVKKKVGEKMMSYEYKEIKVRPEDIVSLLGKEPEFSKVYEDSKFVFFSSNLCAR